jgi:hypothetical protein
MPVTFLLPAGPKNLQSLFPGVDFTQVEEYYLEVQDQDSLEVLATTNSYKRGCCCNDDVFRLFFVNRLGGIDAINFRLMTEEFETVSSSWRKPLQYPLAKWDSGKQRYNVTSNETWVAVNTCFGEEDKEWIKELLATPNAWIQWFGTQGQDDDYLPVVLKDGKFEMQKIEGRYEYVLQIEIEMGNDDINLRN